MNIKQLLTHFIYGVKVHVYSNGYHKSYDPQILYNTIDDDYYCESWFVDWNCDLCIIEPYRISEAD